MTKTATKNISETPDTKEQLPTNFLVDQELFKSASAIKDELDTVNNRLESMTQHKEKVSQEVFQKVLQDYQIKRKDVIERFEEKRKEISKALLNLYTSQSEHESKRSAVQQVLEEAQFRHTLQEYTDKEFSVIEATESEKIASFQKVLDTIADTITEYENILGGPLTDDLKVDATIATPETADDAAEPIEVNTEVSPEDEVAEIDEESISEIMSESVNQEEVLEDPDDLTTAPESSEAELDLEELNSEDLSEEDLGLEDLDLEQIAELQDLDDEEKDDIASLDDELDSFLQDDDSYFEEESKKDDSAAADNLEKEKKAEEEKKEEKPQFDDSLSSILRDIPLEDEEKDEGEKAALPDSFSEAPSDTNAQLDFSKQEGEARLTLEAGDFEEDEVVLGENISMGRSPSNDIVLREAKVSRQHAAINFMNGKFVIVDLKSSNGVYVNSKRIEEHILEDSDIVEIASFKFRFNQ